MTHRAVHALLATTLGAGVLTGCTPADRPDAGRATPTADAASEPAVTAGDTAPATPGPTAPASDPTTPAPAVAIDGVDAARVMAVVEDLAGAGPRPAGSAGDTAARAYVLDAFRAVGWTVREETVPLPQGGTTANVVATPPRVSLDAPHLVVGAHLDTVAGSPGANDNASGIGVLLAVATELADEFDRLPEPVVLVAFGAEEYQPSEPREHHVGSAAYVDAHGDVVAAMVSVDMVGRGEAMCLCTLRGRYDGLAGVLAETATAAGLSGVRRESHGDVSDHGPFALAGIPAAHLWTFDEPARHTAEDTADRVRPEDLRRAGDLVLAWLRGDGREP